MPPIALLSDLPEGSTLGVALDDGTRVCLVNDGGAIRAISDVCTHQGYSMASGNVLGEGRIECGWHGTVYDCRTGAVERGPGLGRELHPLKKNKINDLRDICIRRWPVAY